VELLEVLRAAVSKVERYTQLDIGVVDEGVAVVGYAADHVVHALAELMDNATAYSPPTSPVLVEARRLSDRVVVEVVDAGVGLSAAQRDRLNERLTAPPPVDSEALRSTGLVVVAHIAAWHRMVVRLHNRRGGGTVAEVTLPSALLETTGRHRRQPAATTPLPAILPRLLDRPPDRVPAELAVAPALPALPAQPALPALPAAPSVPSTSAPSTPGGFDGWRIGAADLGWTAAATAATPTPDGLTDRGLPRRRPMAQLVPGSAGAGQQTPIRRDPSAVAAAMSFYRRGLETARARPKRANQEEP
jgi:hypothetical protein